MINPVIRCTRCVRSRKQISRLGPFENLCATPCVVPSACLRRRGKSLIMYYPRAYACDCDLSRWDEADKSPLSTRCFRSVWVERTRRRHGSARDGTDWSVITDRVRTGRTGLESVSYTRSRRDRVHWIEPSEIIFILTLIQNFQFNSAKTVWTGRIMEK